MPEPTWQESKHPRANDGKFGSGSSSTRPEDLPRARPQGDRGTSRPTEPATSSANKAVASASRATSHLVGKLNALAGASAESVTKWKGKLTSWLGERLGKANQERLATASRWIANVEHATLGSLKSASQAMALDVAKTEARNRGLTTSQAATHAEKLTRITKAADLILSWTENIPLAHEVLHHAAHMGSVSSFLLAKVGFYIPVGSLAYLAFSTAVNPMAVADAASKLVAGKLRVDKHAEEEGGITLLVQEEIEELSASLVRAKDPDWYMALVTAALDGTDGDLGRAVDVADACARECPTAPDVKKNAEEDEEDEEDQPVPPPPPRTPRRGDRVVTPVGQSGVVQSNRATQYGGMSRVVASGGNVTQHQNESLRDQKNRQPYDYDESAPGSSTDAIDIYTRRPKKRFAEPDQPERPSGHMSAILAHGMDALAKGGEPHRRFPEALAAHDADGIQAAARAAGLSSRHMQSLGILAPDNSPLSIADSSSPSPPRSSDVILPSVPPTVPPEEAEPATGPPEPGSVGTPELEYPSQTPEEARRFLHGLSASELHHAQFRLMAGQPDSLNADYVGEVHTGGQRMFWKGVGSGDAKHEAYVADLCDLAGVRTPAVRHAHIRRAEKHVNDGGILSEWVRGEDLGDRLTRESLRHGGDEKAAFRDIERRLQPGDVDRNVLFSFLVGLGDRHRGNFRVEGGDKDDAEGWPIPGRLVSIDHEFNHWEKYGGIRTFPLKYRDVAPLITSSLLRDRTSGGNDELFAMELSPHVVADLAGRAEAIALHASRRDPQVGEVVRKHGRILQKLAAKVPGSTYNNTSVRRLLELTKQEYP